MYSFKIHCLGDYCLQSVCLFEIKNLHCKSAFVNSLTLSHVFADVNYQIISSDKFAILAKINLKDKTTFCCFQGGWNHSQEHMDPSVQ